VAHARWRVSEIQAAMAFRADYVICGTSKRHRVKQLGNGVTPPAAECFIRAVIASLDTTRTDLEEAA
jgi:DNA (cytosine-5)-methyltransferase 1